ncbi:prolyl oligopeptidase family serine peptidase [Dysgonomonas sp. ZJ279]|uniref:S9 family peptidase n=1 Tax=Dysgonomonas sp. ZJ279 TaxID=2709796 RepID=UPI0013EE1BEF|nr:prolyl oligopeptidase family serine peptidase [Dysgonomonas sp. ZJ279]
MNLKVIIISICLFLTISVYGQKQQPISEIYTIAPVKITSPIKVDTTNLKGNKFTEKDLLKMSLNIPDQVAFIKHLSPNNDGYFTLDKPTNEATFQLFSFYVGSHRFAKPTLKVMSPNMLEIYIDDKLITTKSTTEDSLHLGKEAKATLSPYPQPNRIVIKILGTAKSKAPDAFKVFIENEDKDSTTTYTIANTNKRPINFTDIMKGKRVSNISISPNGQYILLGYRNSFGEKIITTTELYNTKTNRQILIDTNDSKKQLSWMPNSDKLFYVSKEDINSNLIVIDPATFEENVLIKDIPDERIFFSPDEKTLFYSKQEKGEESKSDLKLLISPEDRQPGYTNRSSIFKYDIATRLSQQLTFGSRSTWINDVSFDSKQILFSFADEAITERPFRKYSMFKLDLATMNVDTLWTDQGFAHRASFSPDATKILISGSAEAFGGIGLNINDGQIANSYDGQAFIMDLNTKKIDPITKNFNPSIDDLFWNKKDNMIYFRTTDKDYVNIYRYNPTTKSYTHLPMKEDVVRTFVLADNALTGAYVGVSQSNSTRAYSYDVKSQQSTLISDPYKERLAILELGQVKDWSFKSSAGEEIIGSYFLPPNFDAAKKYPMIVYYYGGTTPTSRALEGAYPPHVYAALGYVVYVIQPSGAIGFGQKFSALHVNAWGKRTAEDIIEGTKQFVKEHSFVNDKKIGCVGASYGGFMTMYLQTQTDLFAAAVSHAGISSISSYWGEGYWGYTYSSGASAHSYPWNNQEMYVKQSPLFNADKINTPILFTHGTDDTNVPIGESIQMYTALKILGKPTEFIQVKGENHGIANYTRRIEWSNSIFAWFDKWLKDDSSWWDNMYPKK